MHLRFKKLRDGPRGYPPFDLDGSLIKIFVLEDFLKTEKEKFFYLLELNLVSLLIWTQLLAFMILTGRFQFFPNQLYQAS